MIRIIPPSIKEKTKINNYFYLADLGVIFIFSLIGLLIFLIKINNFAKIGILVLLTLIAFLSMLKFTHIKNWNYFIIIFQYFLRNKKIKQVSLNDINLEIDNEIVNFEGNKFSIIELKGIDFEIMPEYMQNKTITILKQVFQRIQAGKIIKLEKPVDLKNYIDKTKKKITTSKNKLAKEILTKEMEYLKLINDSESVKKDTFYLLVYNNNNLELLKETINDTLDILSNPLISDISAKLLKNSEILNFLELFYDKKLDENNNFNLPDILEKRNRLIIDDNKYSFVSIQNLKLFCDNGWLSSIFKLPNVKISLTFNHKKNMLKSIKMIDKTVKELESRISDKSTESQKKDIDNKTEALRELLDDLQIGNEELHDITLVVMFPEEDKKKVLEAIRLANIVPSQLNFLQIKAYEQMLPFNSVFHLKDNIQNLSSITLSASFPFFSKFFQDKNGEYIGFNSESLLFFDLFANLRKEDYTRTNANLFLVGKSGGGKSYFSKYLILKQILNNTNVFVLDPDNEYQKLVNNFNGSFIDVGGAKDGIINPFEVFPMDDDLETNHLNTHRQFLESFFQIIIPGISISELKVLNKIINDMYLRFNITKDTYFNNLDSSNYPTFDDLLEEIKISQKNNNSNRTSEILETLELYLKDFGGDGLHSKLWNGHTTLKLQNKLTVFNFQSLFATQNQLVANAQMALIMKFLMNEVIKNRNYQKDKIMILTDEAHQFINPDYPIALTFLSQMTKRIRKYNGSMVTITQNIKDFIGYSNEVKTKATAVINGCQYALLFGLNPDDINSADELFKKYNGGLNKKELEYLASSGVGEGLFIINSSKRLLFKVETYPEEDKIFEN